MTSIYSFTIIVLPFGQVFMFVNFNYFAEDGRTGTFVIGNDSFPASLLDLPSVVESYKTYDDSVLIKTADVGQVQGRYSHSTSPRHGCFFLRYLYDLFYLLNF